MSIIQTISNDNEFSEWMRQSDSYNNNFSYDGANALQAYLEEFSDDIGESIEFDPIAWCCEFREYENFKELQADYTDIENMEQLLDKTNVIPIENSESFIISEF